MRQQSIVIALILSLTSMALAPIFMDEVGAIAADSLWGSTDLGSQVTPTPGDYQRTRLVSDGEGGAFIVWEEESSSGIHAIVAQHINSTGFPTWRGNSKVVSPSHNQQTWPQIVSDGQGGAIVLWHEQSLLDDFVLAQRLSPSGDFPWGPNARPVCTATGHHLFGQAQSDGQGGVIAAWHNLSGNGNILAQRLNMTGDRQWRTTGVPICTASGFQMALKMASDGNGGAIIVWHDYRNTSAAVFAQKVNLTGAVQWAGNGTPITSTGGSPQVVSDGSGGAYIFWQDTRNGPTDIFAQRVAPDGTPRWNSTGVAVSIADFIQQFYSISEFVDLISYPVVPDGSGGAIVIWGDSSATNGNDLLPYAQRVDRNGTMLWAPNGVPLGLTDARNTVAVADGSGGVIVAMSGPSNYNDYIQLQRLNSSGVLKWGSNGTGVRRAGETQSWPDALCDGRGNAIVAWTNTFSSHNSIISANRFGMRITSADPPEAVEDAPYSNHFESNDNANTTWSVRTEADWLAINASTGMLSGKPDNSDVGSWEVSVTADDGGSYDILDFTLSVVNVPPSFIGMHSNLSVLEDEQLWLDIDSSDEAAGPTFYILFSEQDWLSLDPLTGVLSGIPSNAHVGDNVVNITVNDGNGASARGSIVVTVQNVNDPPTMLTTGLPPAVEDSPYSALCQAVDIDPTRDALGWQLATDAAWLSIDRTSGQLSGTPGDIDPGNHWANVTVEDGNGGSDSRNFTLGVSNVNDAPSWKVVLADAELTEGQDFAEVALAGDPDIGDSVTYSLSSEPPCGARIDVTSGAVVWNNVTGGLYMFDLTASDGNASISHHFNLSVIQNAAPPVNHPPVLDPIPDGKASVGQELRIQFSGHDEDSGDQPLLSFHLVESPAGAVLSGNGTMLWLPRESQAGTCLFTVSVSDGKNNTSESFRVMVTKATSTGKDNGPETGPLYAAIAILLTLSIVMPVLVYLAMRRKGRGGRSIDAQQAAPPGFMGGQPLASPPPPPAGQYPSSPPALPPLPPPEP
jgi:hypothetical protein